jgi:hypothetical protein
MFPVRIGLSTRTKVKNQEPLNGSRRDDNLSEVSI